MTRKDVEMALIQMGCAMKTIVGAYAPNANHMDITVVNGTISVSACEWDAENHDYIVKDILDAVQFKNGGMRINGAYIDADEGAA